jgi:murein DD-endopeptidase MepM/ murein hydrolase activator NlpD
MKVHKKTLWFVGGLSVCLLAGFMGLSSFEADTHPDKGATLSAEPSTPTYLYGIDLTGYTVEDHTIQKGEFLSAILQRYQINLADISLIAENAKNVFDVRKISVGQPYSILVNDEGKADYFIYKPNKVDFYVYELKDQFEVTAFKNEVTTQLHTVAGVINNSLYQTLDEQSISTDLAVSLADIFGGVVNFYRINKGDWFKISYERMEVDGEPVGSGRILSAIFSHHGKEYEAHFFKPEGEEKGAYYDQEGKSLRRAFLKAPLKYSRISSRFTMRRFHPVQKVWKAHLGTDFAAPTGTPIVATGAGVVIASTFDGANGHYVKIQHDKTYTTQYLHMSKRAVKKGDRVAQGEVIGFVGSTGLATGPHVCYRFWKNGKQVDALAQNFPPSEPIKEEHRVAFNQHLQLQQRQLAQANPHETHRKKNSLEVFQFNIEEILAKGSEENSRYFFSII